MTYAYHPNFQTNKIIPVEDALPFHNNANCYQYDDIYEVSKLMCVDETTNSLTVDEEHILTFGYYENMNKFAENVYTDYDEAGGYKELLQGVVGYNFLELSVSYRLPKQVVCVAYDEIDDNTKKILEISLRNIFDEDRRDRIAEFLIEEINTRYRNEDNPLTVEIDGENYSTEYYIDGYYVAMSEIPFRKHGLRTTILRLIIW